MRRGSTAADPAQVAASVLAGEPVALEMDGQPVELAPNEVLVTTQPIEGLAREVVRRVQAMRKDAGFNIEDRISTYYQASGEMTQVMATWSEYIQAETLSTRLVEGAAPEGAYEESHQVDGESLVLAVMKNG